VRTFNWTGKGEPEHETLQKKPRMEGKKIISMPFGLSRIERGGESIQSIM
jgi:hypothetical protein